MSESYRCDRQKTDVPLHSSEFSYACSGSRDSCTCKSTDHTWNSFILDVHNTPMPETHSNSLFMFLVAPCSTLRCTSKYFLYSDLKSQELHWYNGSWSGLWSLECLNKLGLCLVLKLHSLQVNLTTGNSVILKNNRLLYTFLFYIFNGTWWSLHSAQPAHRRKYHFDA